jgi:DNA invertase Pin-like site-specific DNA recombinase
MLRLRTPIKLPVGRRLRVLIYARYSTDEQHPSSITDQFAYCRVFLQANGVTDAEVRELSDAETSGELASRPGINQARELVDARWPDLYVSEDSGRLFRHETACGEHIETVVDNRIRYVGINDDVDTDEEDWDDRLHEAMHHHAKSNKYTIKRIKRKLEGLWRTGAAIGLVRPGYRRRPTVPAATGQPERGPYFDEVDEKWAPVVAEAFARVARKEPPWLVARWLTEQGLPKCGNARSAAWTDRNVIAVVKRTVDRGLDVYRYTVTRKLHRSGARKQVPNEPDLVLTRDLPHLRLVPDALWYAANDAVAGRALAGEPARGPDHPLHGIPRDSRGPLAGVLVCGVCGAKMYMEGRQQGGYRCGNAPNGRCWNKATALQAVVHERIGGAVVGRLTALDGVLDGLLAHARQLYQDDEPRRARRAELEVVIKACEAAMQNLLTAVEQAKESPGPLVERLRRREEERARAKAELEKLDACPSEPSLPTRQELEDHIASTAKSLLGMDREAGALLKPLVGMIRAVPCRQFGGNKVVLRAQFELRLAAFLPDQVLSALRGAGGEAVANRLETVPMAVDLFEPSAGPKHFAEALRLSRDGLKLEEIGSRLGVAKRQAHIAVQYGRDMEAAGLTDPFIELKEPPAEASRWRPHPLQQAP